MSLLLSNHLGIGMKAVITLTSKINTPPRDVMEESKQQQDGTTNNAGQLPTKIYEPKLKPDQYNEATHAEVKANPDLPDYVALDRTTIDSQGRRSMAYLHKPTGDIIPDTERSKFPDQRLRDDHRRQDILRCWMVCENVRPQLLRKTLQFLMQPLYWLGVILSFLIVIWDGYQQGYELQSTEDMIRASAENGSEEEKAEAERAIEAFANDKFSDVEALGKTALDAYGRRSTAYLNKKTGAIITSTDMTEHYIQDVPMRKYQRRADVAWCWLLCEGVRPQVVRIVLRAIGVPFFLVFLGVNFLLLERDIKKERKED